MAIGTYPELIAAVAKWLNRVDLTEQIPDFITLAESRLNREMRLRVMETEAPLTILDGARSVALPGDFLEPLDLWVEETYGRRSLRYLDASQGQVLTATGTITEWGITGADLDVLRPVSGDMALILRYLAKFGLSEASPTNWLLTNHPDVYLFAALVEAAPYLKDTNALAVWSARLQQAMDEVNRQEARSKGLSSLTVEFPSAWRSNRRRGGGYGQFG